MEPNQVAATLTALVGLVALIIAVAAWRAMIRAGNRNIVFVAAGFALFTIKSGIKAWHLLLAPETLAWEVAFSLMDLAAVVLIVWPLVPLGRRPVP